MSGIEKSGGQAVGVWMRTSVGEAKSWRWGIFWAIDRVLTFLKTTNCSRPTHNDSARSRQYEDSVEGHTRGAYEPGVSGYRAL